MPAPEDDPENDDPEKDDPEKDNPMTITRIPLLAAAFAVSLALTGCASAATSDADTEPGGTAQESTEPSDTAETNADSGDAPSTATAGTYVEYRDGIIAETAGEKALFFHAPWCPQCRELEESILTGMIPDDFTIIKVDFDTATALRQQYGVTLQTTIVYVDDDGEKLGSAVLYDETTLDALVAAAP